MWLSTGPRSLQPCPLMPRLLLPCPLQLAAHVLHLGIISRVRKRRKKTSDCLTAGRTTLKISKKSLLILLFCLMSFTGLHTIRQWTNKPVERGTLCYLLTVPAVFWLSLVPAPSEDSEAKTIYMNRCFRIWTVSGFNPETYSRTKQKSSKQIQCFKLNFPCLENNRHICSTKIPK